VSKRPKWRGEPNPRKEPISRFRPTETKIPKLSMPSHRGTQISWRFSSADRGGPFAWHAIEEPGHYREIMEKLHQFETMEEQVIRRQGSHPVELESLCKEARDRLTELRLDDLDELMSFRIDGRGRVWCRMVQGMMVILWHDPGHDVCPSLKKRT
jgi:hypothetical protein